VITTGVMNDFSVAGKFRQGGAKRRWYGCRRVRAGAGGARLGQSGQDLADPLTVSRWRYGLGWAPSPLPHAKADRLGRGGRDMILGGGGAMFGATSQLRALRRI